MPFLEAYLLATMKLPGVQPKQVHGWYLAVYVDAVEWVELPDTLGMSPHCKGCRPCTIAPRLSVVAGSG